MAGRSEASLANIEPLNQETSLYPGEENRSGEGYDVLGERWLAKEVHDGLKHYNMFHEFGEIERKIEELIVEVDQGKHSPSTVDRSRLRNKYFFGERYTYGDGFGEEMLFPLGQIDRIPSWISNLIIAPLELAGVLPVGFINSAVINLYLPGGCIVSHIDPPQIFERPIVSVSFLSDSMLSFGCKFTYKPMRITSPVTTVKLKRGCVLSMSGFAADGITHCIRPQDLKARRAAVILRRVLPDAPRLSWGHYLSISKRLHGFSHLHRIQRKRGWEESERSLLDIGPKRARFDFKQYYLKKL